MRWTYFCTCCSIPFSRQNDNARFNFLRSTRFTTPVSLLTLCFTMHVMIGFSSSSESSSELSAKSSWAKLTLLNFLTSIVAEDFNVAHCLFRSCLQLSALLWRLMLISRGNLGHRRTYLMMNTVMTFDTLHLHSHICKAFLAVKNKGEKPGVWKSSITVTHLRIGYSIVCKLTI